MKPRDLLLALLLISGIVATGTAWAASPAEIQQWKTECDNGNAESCLHLGLRYDLGQGVTQDYSQAADLYRKACDGGGGGERVFQPRGAVCRRSGGHAECLCGIDVLRQGMRPERGKGL